MDGITVSNEIFRCLIPGKRLDNLLRDPLRSRMRRHRMMNLSWSRKTGQGAKVYSTG
jgi:hypothetical protein